MKDWVGNVNSVWKISGASNHSAQEREQDDYYATDPKAIDKLLSVEQLNSRIWECACGGGHLSERLTEHGFYVCSTDIKDRGYKRLSVIKDFLKAKTVPFNQPFDIVTNPPSAPVVYCNGHVAPDKPIKTLPKQKPPAVEASGARKNKTSERVK